jgi:hypothetical protein
MSGKERLWLQDALDLERMDQRPEQDSKHNQWRLHLLVTSGLATPCAHCGFLESTDTVLKATVAYTVKVLDKRKLQEYRRAVPIYETLSGLYSFPGKPAQTSITHENQDTLSDSVPWFSMATEAWAPMKDRVVMWLAEDVQGTRRYWCSMECRQQWLQYRIAQLGKKDPNYKARAVSFTDGQQFTLKSKRGDFTELVRL